MGFIDGDGGCGQVFLEGKIGGETADSGTHDDDFHGCFYETISLCRTAHPLEHRDDPPASESVPQTWIESEQDEIPPKLPGLHSTSCQRHYTIRPPISRHPLPSRPYFLPFRYVSTGT